MQVTDDPTSLSAAKVLPAQLECSDKLRYKCGRCRTSQFASRTWLKKHVYAEHWPLKVKFSSECNYVSAYEERLQKQACLTFPWRAVIMQ